MADTKQSPPRQTVKDFVRKYPSEAPGPAHPCDAPGLSPIEFLQAVYRDPLLPMSIRIDAARGLLPYTEPRPTNSFPHRCKIIIGGLGSPPDDPERINSDRQLKSEIASQNRQPLPGDPGSSNIETTSYPQTLPDYSTAPTPEEIQEIKAAVNRLRPDLARLPVPEPRFCHCGHWVVGYYPCCEHERDPSKMN